MPVDRKSFRHGSPYKTFSSLPHGWCKKIADDDDYFVTSTAVDPTSVPNSALPKLLTLAQRFNPGPTTLAVTLTDTDNSLVVELEFDFYDAFGERRVERQTFGPPTGGAAGIRQTTFPVQTLNAIRITNLIGHGATDAIKIGIVGAAGSGNTGLGIQIPRHLKNTGEYQVRRGVTSQAAESSPLKAADYYQGVFFPAAIATETEWFVICQPEA